MDLGIAVKKACENVTQTLKFLYPLDISIKEKIEAIAKSYGAAGVEYSEQVVYFLVFLKKIDNVHLSIWKLIKYFYLEILQHLLMTFP